jgi:dsRNA-specific ribonuclease
MQKTPINIIRQLYEFPGANPKFGKTIVDENEVYVELRFTCKKEVIKAHGVGQNRADAKKAAAKIALQNLKR